MPDQDKQCPYCGSTDLIKSSRGDVQFTWCYKCLRGNPELEARLRGQNA